MATLVNSGEGRANQSDVSGGPESSNHIAHMAPGTLWIVYFALLVLLAITVGLYYVDLQKFVPFVGLNLIVALTVAVIKAGLVIWYFMNVKNSTRLVWLWAGLGFVWLLLMGGIFMDYQSRAWLDAPGWQEAAPPAYFTQP